jgi:hypothetical protein
MNPELLDILDRGLRYSLWLFLACYLVILFIGWSRLRRRKRQIGELFEQMHTPEEEAEWSRKTSLLNEWPVVFNGLILSLVVGILFFVVYCFVPLPFAQNLVTTSNWQVTPLRVTALQYDRFYEGFSLTGDVWNQTESPIPDLEAEVDVIGDDGTTIDEIRTPVKPKVLPPGKSGTFELRYTDKSPLIKGYRIAFLDSAGKQIPHLTGFDAD